jgi:nucleotide-binding universal stress UspA family protein
VVRIVIATAGVLSPEPVARFAERLAGPDGTVIVTTVIEVPRSFLDELRSEQWHPLAEGSPPWTTEEDALIARYVDERGGRITEPLLAALSAHGVEAEVMFLEGEDPAVTIIAAAAEVDADLIVMGATKPLFDETSWQSVSTRVVREAGRPVLVVPSPPNVESAE